jgi:hypothetical protein
MNTLEFCEKYLENYTINPDNTIDVNGNVNLNDRLGDMEKLPVKFGKVSGNFSCGWNKLTTLEGCPNYIGGDFSCYNNNLTTLEYCPNYVGDIFNCFGNNLTTLEGCPKYVGDNFIYHANEILVQRINNLKQLYNIDFVKDEIYYKLLSKSSIDKDEAIYAKLIL